MFHQRQQALQYQTIGNHPYAQFATQHASNGIFIHFACTRCGDQTTVRCMNPQRLNLRLARYAAMHAHGLRPVRR